MDSYEYSVVLIDLDAGSGEESYITNSPISVVDGINTYTPVPEMEIKPATLTGDFSNSEYRINNLPANLALISGLAINLPYSKVSVVIREFFYDGAGALTGSEYLFRGFVYQCESRKARGRADLILKDNKYYTDTTAGIPCTELCAVSYFGDGICQKTVHSEPHTVSVISGYSLTVGESLIDTTAFLFKNGYIENGAQRLKIKYHETGTTFQMARPVPASWDGALVTVYAGCDRQLSTCRDIHNNEARFLGLGISMVDYNPLYETT